MNSNAEEPAKMVLERLLRIEASEGLRSFDVAGSSIQLVQESLRRFAKIASEFTEMQELTARDVINMDIAKVFCPASMIPNGFAVAIRQMPATYARRYASNHVHWVLASPSNLQDPYEPLLRLFERGGECFIHHGFIHVNH
jgi:hypothetical protein